VTRPPQAVKIHAADNVAVALGTLAAPSSPPVPLSFQESGDVGRSPSLDVASGRKLANNEKHGYREIAIWKEGVTL